MNFWSFSPRIVFSGLLNVLKVLWNHHEDNDSKFSTHFYNNCNFSHLHWGYVQLIPFKYFSRNSINKNCDKGEILLGIIKGGLLLLIQTRDTFIIEQVLNPLGLK